MKKRFKELLSKIHKLDLKEQEKILNNTLSDWMGVNDQIDDITVMAIRWKI